MNKFLNLTSDKLYKSRQEEIYYDNIKFNITITTMSIEHTSHSHGMASGIIFLIQQKSMSYVPFISLSMTKV